MVIIDLSVKWIPGRNSQSAETSSRSWFWNSDDDDGAYGADDEGEDYHHRSCCSVTGAGGTTHVYVGTCALDAGQATWL